MTCEDCHGTGYRTGYRMRPVIDIATSHVIYRASRPCPSCRGSGQRSCCEGMVGKAKDVTNGGEDD